MLGFRSTSISTVKGIFAASYFGTNGGCRTIVYNNFPWCNPTDKQKQTIEEKAQAVLNARALYPQSTLADLYDPLTMPAELRNAHNDLDKVVEKAYCKVFTKDSERVDFLFERYKELTKDLFTEGLVKKRKRNVNIPLRK